VEGGGNSGPQPHLQRDLAPVAPPTHERPLQAKCSDQCRRVVRQEFETQVPTRIRRSPCPRLSNVMTRNRAASRVARSVYTSLERSLGCTRTTG